MASSRLSENQINIRIVPKRVRWPECGTSNAWTKAHDCVDAYQDLVRGVDLACAEAEQDPELSGSGIVRRRAEICDQTMTKLFNFRPFEIAEKALAGDVNALEGLEDRNPQQVQMLLKLKQARVDLQEGVEATKRMVRERCKVGERVSV